MNSKAVNRRADFPVRSDVQTEPPHVLRSPSFKILAMATLLAVCAGCQNVKPWQRGTLADVTMRADRDPIGTAMDEHIFFSREAASGGRGVGGGGCGCN